MMMLEDLFASNPRLFTILSFSPFVNIAILYLIYRVFFHPLRHVPGPQLASITSLWHWYHVYQGTECSVDRDLHAKYGPVVRLGPDDVSISDPAAINDIYIDRGGFSKASYYSKFDVDDHETILSTRDLIYRTKRAKPIFSMFSPRAIREGMTGIEEVVSHFVSNLKNAREASGKGKEAAKGDTVTYDILGPSRAIALDTVTAYLFGKSFGALAKEARLYGDGFSIAGFAGSSNAASKFFLLPTFAFNYLMFFVNLIFKEKHVRRSVNDVDRYVKDLVKSANKDDDTYHSRLLQAGIPKEEIEAQCKDIMFAGTDTTGTTLAMTCWFLAKTKDSYSRLRKEVMANQAEPDPQALPYLRAVIQEGLRLSIPNPTRLPRVVPKEGWTFGGFTFPEGTIVGCASYCLHLDPKTFPDPFEFRPERWLDPTEEMTKASFAFGAGTRSCIARNLAMVELLVAVRRVVEEDVLRGARPLKDKIERSEWYSSKVIDGSIKLQWS